MQPSSVFVYGTLKPGERNFRVAERGGKFVSAAGHIENHVLYHFEPENYPGVIAGDGVVHGYILTYENITRALPMLDELEGTDSSPPLYDRVVVNVLPRNEPAYLYVYHDTSRCLQDSAIRMDSGVWKPQSGEEGLYP